MSSSEIERFISNWNRIHKQTSRAIKAAPDAQMSWRPQEGMFTLRELVSHIPVAELMLTRTAIEGTTQKVESDLGERSAEEIAALFDAQHEKLVEEVSRLTAEQLGETIEFYGNKMPRAALLWGMTEHEIHHRGQLYTYLRLAGVEPPNLFGV